MIRLSKGKLILVQFLIYVVSVFLGLELYFRMTESQFVPKAKNKPYERFVHRKMEMAWTKKKEHFLDPPFSFFRNVRVHDNERLKNILDFMLLPANQEFRSPDFLTGTWESWMEFKTNSHGLRNKYTMSKKRSDAFRVLMIGSYLTFGHGVSDGSKVSDFLELSLNQQFKKEIGKTFEVWTLGVPTATAIMGLAFWERFGNEIDPDLVILDFGFVDQGTSSYDFIAPGEEDLGRLPKGAFELNWKRKFWNVPFVAYKYNFLNSMVINKLAVLIGGDLPAHVRVSEWTVAMKRFNEIFAEKKIPHFMIDQFGADISSFDKVSKESGIPYFKLKSLLTLAPSDPIEAKRFESQSNWTHEISDAMERKNVLSRNRILREKPYILSSVFQYGNLGNKLAGEFLASCIYVWVTKNTHCE